MPDLPTAPRAIVVMGVSGSGKTTLAKALAERLGYAFLEGDDLHPPANRGKMARGVPLDDEDRWPWLATVGAALQAEAERGGVVAACSALRRSYRDLISRQAGQPVVFIHLVLERQALAERMRGRSGHYMPVALLDSQLATLELPGPGEAAISLPADRPARELVERLLQAWRERPAGDRAAGPSTDD